MKNDSKKKSPTLAQTRAIYNAGLQSYQASYAMMVDDIMDGMRAPAKKAGRTPFYDVSWFQEMARFIRAHRSWESLGEDVQQRLHNALREAT